MRTSRVVGGRGTRAAKRVQLAWVSVASAVLLFAIGCSSRSDAPEEALAKAQYEKQFEELIKPGTLKLTSFRKTNGVVKEGGNAYSMEYEAELSFPKGWLPQCVDMKKFDMGCQMARTQGAKPQKVGAIVKDKGAIVFEKTEKGWRPSGMNAGWLDPFGG